MMEEQTISFIQILQVGGLAGVVSAIVGGLVREISSWSERKRKAKFLALKLALLLEGHFRTCVDQVDDLENFISSRGSAGDNKPYLPEFGELPLDADAWLYLHRKAAEEVLNFPARIEAINAAIEDDFFYGNDPTGPDPDVTLVPLYKHLFAALDLARYVRRKHRLGELTRTQSTEARMLERQNRLKERMHAKEVAADIFV